MSFRTVVITRQSKISYKNRYLVVKKESEEKYIHLSEIDTIMVDSLSVSISAYLLKELSNNKINIIFCDETHNPYGELAFYYIRHNSSKQIREQIKWKEADKNLLWTSIIHDKIFNQSQLLKKLKLEKSKLLLSYLNEIQMGDKTNREGHAAKVYFNELFGKNFSRDETNKINDALNYGYTVLLSTISKEIVSNGYLTQLGIHHKNEFNEFNLSCDLMEPFRVIIDNFVYYNKDREFDTSYKLDIVNIFNNNYKYLGKKYTLKDIIKFYVKETLDSVKDISKYKGYIYEEG